MRRERRRHSPATTKSVSSETSLSSSRMIETVPVLPGESVADFLANDLEGPARRRTRRTISDCDSQVNSPEVSDFR